MGEPPAMPAQSPEMGLSASIGLCASWALPLSSWLTTAFTG